MLVFTRDFYPLRNSRDLRGPLLVDIPKSVRTPGVALKMHLIETPEDPPLNAWKALEWKPAEVVFWVFPGSEPQDESLP